MAIFDDQTGGISDAALATRLAAAGLTVATASSATPAALGTAAAGSSGSFARGDHVHSNTASSLITNATITGGLTKGAFSYGTIPYSATGNFASFNVGVDSYSQIIVSNSNATGTASANVIVSNDLGTDTTYNGAFGINSSGFTDAGVILNKANSTYLSCVSGDLAIGTQGATAVHFGANSWTADAITISATNVPSIFNGNFMSAAPANGQLMQIQSLTEVTTIAASAYTDTTIQIPAGAIVLGVSVRVTAAVTCTTNFTVGVSGSTAAFSTAAVAKTLNATDKGTKAGAYYSATLQSVRITPDTTPSDNTGRVRVTIHYISVTAPTS